MTYTINHKFKVTQARKMLTREEREAHVPIFDSAAWVKRKDKRSDKQLTQQDEGAMRREQRRVENLALHQAVLANQKR